MSFFFSVYQFIWTQTSHLFDLLSIRLKYKLEIATKLNLLPLSLFFQQLNIGFIFLYEQNNSSLILKNIRKVAIKRIPQIY